MALGLRAKYLELQKSRTEFASTVIGAANKLAIAVGALVTFGYLFLIHFFPSGLTTGEVIFFLFIALAFVFIYLAFLAYGAFSFLWIAHVLTFLFQLPRFRYRSHKLHGAKFAAFLNKRRVARLVGPSRASKFREAWRALRRRATRSVIQGRTLVPPFARGWWLGLSSLLVSATILDAALQANSIRFWEFVVTSYICGFFLILMSHAPIRHRRKRYRQATRLCGVFVVPLLLLLFQIGPKPLLELAFEATGLRIANASIEVPIAEASAIERIAEHIQSPLIDCRRPQADKILVHNAEILWTGVGDQTVVRFGPKRPDKKLIFGPDVDDVPNGIVRFDSKSVKLMRVSPRLDPCFDIPSDLLFETGSHALMPGATERIEKLVLTLREVGEPSSIIVIGHSDPRQMSKHLNDKSILDNQRLSELRALAIARVIRAQTTLSNIAIFPEGVGSREPKVKCASDKGISKYELEQCNKPNRRVEIRVAYKQKKAKMASSPEAKTSN